MREIVKCCKHVKLNFTFKVCAYRVCVCAVRQKSKMASNIFPPYVHTLYSFFLNVGKIVNMIHFTFLIKLYYITNLKEFCRYN